MADDLSGLESSGSSNPTVNASRMGTTEFAYNKLVSTESTGHIRDERGNRVAVPERAVISPELREKYRRYITDYAENISQVYRTNPDVFRNPNVGHNRDILSLLAASKGEGAWEVDQKKINDLLNNERGWELANEIMEYQTALKLFALGMYAMTNPGSEKHYEGEDFVYRFGEGQRVGNRWWHNTVEPHLDSLIVAGRTAAATVAGGVVGFIGSGGRPGGGAVGAGVTLGAIGAGALVRSFAEQGIRINTRQCIETFRVLQADPATSEYMRRALHIDLRDFQEVGGQIVRTARVPQTRDTKVIEGEAMEALVTRAEYLHTALKIPLDKLDSLPEQFVYLAGNADQDRRQPEQIGLRSNQRLNEIFDDLGGVRDSLGRQRGDPLFGTGGAVIAYQENYTRFMQARRRLITEIRQDYVQNNVLNVDRVSKIKSSISEGIRARQENGALMTNRQNEIQGRINTTEGDRTRLQTEIDSVSNYSESVRKLRDARDAVRFAIESNFPPPPPATIEAALVRLKSVMSIPGVDFTFSDGQIVRSVLDRKVASANQESIDNADWERRNPQGARNDETYKKIRDPAFDANHTQRLARDEAIDADAARLTQLISRLEQLQSDMRETQSALGEGEEVVVKGVEPLTALQADFNAISGLNRRGVNLTEAALRTQSFEEILRRINEANRLNSNRGWPAAMNGREAFRNMVVHAMVEAKARNGTVLAAPGAEFANFTNAATWNISENMLRSLTPEQLQAEMVTRQVRNPGVLAGLPIPDPANAAERVQYENAIREANERLQIRQNFLRNELRIVTDQKTQLEEDKKGVGAQFERDLQTLNTVNDLMGRQENVLAEGAERLVDDPNRARFFNDTPVAVNDANYTDVEKATPQPVGYYEMLDLLFDYKAKSNRSEYYRRLSTALPPDRLADLLNTHMGLGLAAPATLPDALNGFNTSINTYRMGAPDISEGFRRMIAQLADEANALL